MYFCIFVLFFILCNDILYFSFFFFFNDTATTEIYTLSLHDALPIRRRLGAARALDIFQPRSGPIDAPLHLLEEILVEPLVALHVIAHAGRRVEIDRLERPHERPAQGEALSDPDIDVLRRRIAVGDEAEGFFEQGALQTIHDEAVELALHHDRRLAGFDEEGAGALDDVGRRPRRWDDLSRRNEVGRIERMND